MRISALNFWFRFCFFERLIHLANLFLRIKLYWMLLAGVAFIYPWVAYNLCACFMNFKKSFFFSWKHYRFHSVNASTVTSKLRCNWTLYEVVDTSVQRYKATVLTRFIFAAVKMGNLCHVCESTRTPHNVARVLCTDSRRSWRQAVGCPRRCAFCSFFLRTSSMRSFASNVAVTCSVMC